MESKSCQELIGMMENPDERDVAYEAFFRKYQPVVFRYLRSLSSSLTSEDIEDISQEFFLKVYRKAEHTGKIHTSYEAWWRAVCRNTFYSWAKTKSHKFDKLIIKSEDPTDPPDDKGIHKQRLLDHWDCVVHIVAELKKTHPGRWRICSLLVMGFERKEIEKIEAKSSSATGNILYHIHKQLQELREEHCE